jgi:hypothetical protein
MATADAFVQPWVLQLRLAEKAEPHRPINRGIQQIVSREKSNDDECQADGDEKERAFSSKSKSRHRQTKNLLDWIEEHWASADFLEIRLDATLVACYVLSRFLIYDIATGVKAVPGWELEDWIRILSTISSAIVLSLYWTFGGLVVTQSFEDSFVSDVDGRSSWWALTLVNVLVATPLWLLTEQTFRFGPPGIESFYTDEVYLFSGLGLSSNMILVKLATVNVR